MPEYVHTEQKAERRDCGARKWYSNIKFEAGEVQTKGFNIIMIYKRESK